MKTVLFKWISVLLSCNSKTAQQNSNVAAFNTIRLFMLAVIFFQVCCHNSYSNKSKDKENKQKDSNFVNEPQHVKNLSTYTDSFCSSDKNLSQCCFSFNKRINDSLEECYSKFEGPEGSYLSIGGIKQTLHPKKISGGINGDVYYISGKEYMQKVIFLDKKSDTLFLKLVLGREGKDDNHCIHQIHFVFRSNENIKVVILDH